MLAYSLAFCLLFSGFTFAMEDDRDRLVICPFLTQEYIINDEEWLHEEHSLESAKRTYGSELATVEDQQHIHKDLALFGFDNELIEIYAGNNYCPALILVDYKKDNPVKALWTYHDTDKLRQDLAYLQLISFAALIKQRQSAPGKNIISIGELLKQSVLQSIRILLTKNDKRGLPCLTTLTEECVINADTAMKLALEKIKSEFSESVPRPS